MDTIFINDLVLEGIHGLTEKEKKESQRFKIDLKLNTLSGAHHTDQIEDTLDYRLVRSIAQEIVRQKSFSLLETLGHEIAEAILEKTVARSVGVTVTKLDIWGNGQPGVTIHQNKLPTHLDLLDFDLEEIFERITTDGAVGFPILPVRRKLHLLREALGYKYERQPEILNGGTVIEQLSSVTVFPEDSPFHQLRNDFNELLIRKFSTFPIKDVFQEPLHLEEMSLQKYDVGSIGITPHRDGKSRINFICVFILCGGGQVGICDDRAGSNPLLLDVQPGNMFILRGPGFLHSTFQPFHFVRNITEERIVFGLRQRLKK